MPAKFKNNATATIAASISSSDTTIVLSSSSGSLFPVLSAGQYFYATLYTALGVYEIVKVTARAGDSLTVVRGQDGTSASSFTAGDGFAQRLVAASLDNFPQLDANNTFTGTNSFTGGTFTGGTLSGNTVTNPTLTGGTINNTPIGGVTRSTGAFTDVSISSLAANTVVLGNGTGNLQSVAPGTNGNVLTSNGTTWTSAPLAGGLAAGGAVYENSQIITSNYTLIAGKNGLSAGPITIDTGVTVTVSTGSTWVVV